MSLSKKIRFEVFKRDSFTCQYCGRKAPDVLLECDHIHPKADGGADDILNLVTACADCNRGKGAVPLSDGAAVERRRQQLEDLQERREQIEMMVEWQRSMADLDAEGVDQAIGFFSEQTGWGLTEASGDKMRRHVRRFGLLEVMEAIRIASDKYLERQDGVVTRDSAGTAFEKIGGICFNRQRYAKDPRAEEMDREMWKFVREYEAQCSSYPDARYLRKFWRERVEPSLKDADDLAGAGNAVVDACLASYYDGPHRSYWDALRDTTFPWEGNPDA